MASCPLEALPTRMVSTDKFPAEPVLVTLDGNCEDNSPIDLRSSKYHIDASKSFFIFW